MKFRFCGDLDCPDWALAEMSTLSKLTSIKMKLLCGQVLKHLLGGQIDYEKVQKLTADAKFEASEIKASISGLSFILSSAAKHSVDGDSLCRELQQLGLPKEHSTVLCRTYADNMDKLQAELRKQSLRLSHLESVDWRVDYILSSSKLKDVNEPSVQLRLKIRNPDTGMINHTSFLLPQDKFRVILNEMKEALLMMDALSSR